MMDGRVSVFSLFSLASLSLTLFIVWFSERCQDEGEGERVLDGGLGFIGKFVSPYIRMMATYRYFSFHF